MLSPAAFLALTRALYSFPMVSPVNFFVLIVEPALKSVVVPAAMSSSSTSYPVIALPPVAGATHVTS